MKTCIHCRELKPETEYYRHPMMADGRLGACKSCHKSRMKDNYRAKREEKSAYEQLRNKRPERKAYQIDRARRQRATNPLKPIARQLVSNAVRNGWLVRLPCEVCGDADSQGHHEDYTKPLEVRWLCFKHHREAHGQVVTSDYRPKRRKKAA